MIYLMLCLTTGTLGGRGGRQSGKHTKQKRNKNKSNNTGERKVQIEMGRGDKSHNYSDRET